MQKKSLNLYTLDIKYVRDLSKADDKVMSISPQRGKETRPFVGLVIICENKKYCIPLTSPKKKHEKMKNDLDFSKIFDKNGKLIGALNFNNMIPVSDDVIIPLNVKSNKNDVPRDKIYKELLNNQLDWCNENAKQIISKANRLYHFVTVTPEKSRNLTRRCCNFKKLEVVLEKHLGISKEALEKLKAEKFKLEVHNRVLSSYENVRKMYNAAAEKYFQDRPRSKPIDINSTISDQLAAAKKLFDESMCIVKSNPNLYKAYTKALEETVGDQSHKEAKKHNPMP